MRISHMRNVFPREYDEKWSGEILMVFIMVSERRLRGRLPVYWLKDYQNDEIKETFYQAELQKVDVREDDEFKVEKILKTKGRGRNKQCIGYICLQSLIRGTMQIIW